MVRLGRRQQPFVQRQSNQSNIRRLIAPSKRSFRLILICLAFVAFFPPIFFHFRLRRFHQMQLKKCGWLDGSPLVCAHGGDSTNEFPNSMAAYRSALRSQVDCVEIDVSRSLDGVLLALHDRDLQRISGNITSKVGHLSMKEIIKLGTSFQFAQKSHDQVITTIEDALTLVSNSVRKVILDAKVGPPSYEKGLAKDILSVIERTKCYNCLVWAKSDNLVRDIMRLSSNVSAGYIIMVDRSTGFRTNLLRIRKAGVVGVYHPLIDEKLVRTFHGRNKRVFAWTVDDEDSMRKMLHERVDAVVTSNPILFQRVMQDIRTQCLEEGFSLIR
ncbi:glycerophosphodiester phosphodiesterase GDPD4 [Citrus sinensis]|uniref:glycerophosphodiester phosphodiesterase GDPD4 isoform X1 n=1 Tax=Citrus sinensis TaxID=2711 RepID=UPI000CED62D2|nr:glycerophosphodiester phosphodiesterase GDPD4 isoform X1 [Citrus sinensis]XP_024045531.1 glycerophosphodiester phosphodiesterase GDPD4 isoform X1 [Citrus x clementina]KAH9725996.1 glycerophosphodiester phosphodiesterase GDPD4 [Citrus sinensis]